MESNTVLQGEGIMSMENTVEARFVFCVFELYFHLSGGVDMIGAAFGLACIVCVEDLREDWWLERLFYFLVLLLPAFTSSFF